MVRRALLHGSTLQEIAAGSKNLVANLSIRGKSERKKIAKIHRDLISSRGSVSDSSKLESVKSETERSASSESSDDYETAKMEAMAMVDFARVTKATASKDIQINVKDLNMVHLGTALMG